MNFLNILNLVGGIILSVIGIILATKGIIEVNDGGLFFFGFALLFLVVGLPMLMEFHFGRIRNRKSRSLNLKEVK